jgi:hypothetical protein
MNLGVYSASIKTSIRKYFWVRSARNLNTTIGEPIFQTMWDPQHLTTPYTSTACYWDSFTFFNM